MSPLSAGGSTTQLLKCKLILFTIIERYIKVLTITSNKTAMERENDIQIRLLFWTCQRSSNSILGVFINNIRIHSYSDLLRGDSLNHLKPPNLNPQFKPPLSIFISNGGGGLLIRGLNSAEHSETFQNTKWYILSI